MISHVSLGQVPVRPHLPKPGLICSYTQHEIIEHLSCAWEYKKLIFQWVKHLSKQLIRLLGQGAQGAARAQRKAWWKWGGRGEWAQALAYPSSAALVQRFDFLFSQPWGLIGIKYPSKYGVARPWPYSLLFFFLTTDICHQCHFLLPTPS